jgi:mercuric ion transport protein
MAFTVRTRNATTMTDNPRADANAGRKMASETGATLLVAGGLVSAFGAASCCALPVLLGSFGLWLGSIALLAGPHCLGLLAAAVICLVAGGGVLLWRRGVTTCAPGAVCGRPMPSALIAGALSLGPILTVLGFVFA